MANSFACQMVTADFPRKNRRSHGFLIAMPASPCLHRHVCIAMSARKARRHRPSARVHPLRARASLTHNKK
jgi:hypothetical protein